MGRGGESDRCRFFHRKNQQTHTFQGFQGLNIKNFKLLRGKALTKKPTSVRGGEWERGRGGNREMGRETGFLRVLCLGRRNLGINRVSEVTRQD